MDSNFHVQNEILNLEFVKRRLVDKTGDLTIWGNSILKAYSKVALFSFIPSIAWKNKRRYLVYGSRIINKISDIHCNDVHLVMSARDPLRLNRMPSSFTYDLQSWLDVSKSIHSNKSDGLINLQKRIADCIRSTGAICFVANSTVDPINRLWLFTARQAGLMTVCVQHGVFASNMPDIIQEEDIVDRYIALDETQASIVSKSIDRRKIVSLGRRSEFQWIPPSAAPTICFVGEDWERYGFIELKKILVDRYKAIGKALRKKGIAYFYKPHPSEKSTFYKEMPLLSRSNFERPDVYIGFASSMLREVTSLGKLSIQILDHRFAIDNYQENGYCISLNNDQYLIDSIIYIIANPHVVPYIREASLGEILFA